MTRFNQIGSDEFVREASTMILPASSSSLGDSLRAVTLSCTRVKFSKEKKYVWQVPDFWSSLVCSEFS
jgi:hypothetical protein